MLFPFVVTGTVVCGVLKCDKAVKSASHIWLKTCTPVAEL
jgi:hypothetical protein